MEKELSKIGHCKHGEFVLLDGCPECIAERIASIAKEQEAQQGPEVTKLIAAAAEATEVFTQDELEAGTLPLPEVASTTALVNPAEDEKAIALYNEGVKLLAFAEARVITVNDDLKPAADDLSIILKTKKALEAIRKEYVDPIRANLDAFNAAFKAFAAPLLDADTINRKKLADYDAEVRRKVAEAEEVNRQAEALAKKQAELSGTGEFTVDTKPIEVAPAPGRTRTDMGSAGMVKVRKYRVVDFAALHDQYKIENSVLLNKVVKAGIPEITGVEIYEDLVVRVTPR